MRALPLLPGLVAALALLPTPSAAVPPDAAPRADRPEGVPVSALPAAPAAPGAGGSRIHLLGGSFDPLSQRLDFSSVALEDGAGAEDPYGLVQLLPGALDARRELEAAGVRFYGYVPDDAFQVRLSGEARRLLAAHPAVRWVGEWRPGYRVHPRLWPGADRTPVPELRLHAFPDASAGKLAARLTAEFPTVTLVHLREGGPAPAARLSVPGSVRDALVARAASLPGVAFLEPYDPPSLHNVDASGPVQGNTASPQGRTIFARGITGTGQIVAVSDSGCDSDICFFRHLNGVTAVTDAATTVPPEMGPLHPTRKVIGYWVQPGATAYDNDNVCSSSSTSFHGTHTSGTVVGDNLATPSSPTNAGVDFGDGMAPNGQLLFQDVGDDASGCLSGLSDLEAMFLQALRGGARVHSNSWGGTTYGVYAGDDQSTDRFLFDHEEMAIFYSAGNEGTPVPPRTSTIGSPGVSKNAVTVGALGHGTSTTVTSFSSRGPTADGRVKPDVMAPGSSTVSAGGNTSHTDLGCATRSLSGTSMSCPTAAGAAALLRQYFADGFYPSGSKNPADARELSAPEVKAVLLNGTYPLPVGGTFGSGSYGWGRVFLDSNLYFSGEARKLRLSSLPNAQGLVTGETRSLTVTVSSGEELRATLVWSDPEATLGAARALVNDLDLVVSDGTRSWRGNVLSTTGESVEGGSADAVNNVEQVRLPVPGAGTYTITVTAARVPGNGRPGTSRQGYALAVSNRSCATAVSAAPSNLVATSDAVMGVNLSFSPASGSSATQVYRAEGDCGSPASAFVPVGTATGGTYHDARAQGGQTYAYRLRGSDGCGEGPASSCTSIVPAGRCDLLPEFDGLSSAAADVPNCRVVLTWAPGTVRCASPSGPARYNVYRSRTPGFTPSSESLVASVAGTRYEDQTPGLSTGTTYFYVVRMEDGTRGSSGPHGGNEEGNLVERFATAVGAPGTSGGGFTDGAGDGGALLAPEAPWAISDKEARSGGFSYHSGPRDGFYPANTCAALTTPSLVLGTNAVLSYWVRYNLEVNWDGVVVEVSTNGGSSWSDLPPTSPSGYPGTLSETGAPPVNACAYSATHGAFTGPGQNDALTPWTRYETSLSAHAGKTVKVRWRLTSDPGLEFEGFYLDDVSVTNAAGPGACAPVTFDPAPDTGLPGPGKK